jgi:hypothetical protein
MTENAWRKGDAALVVALAAGKTVRQAVAEARSKLVDAALGQLADASAEAVTTLRALLHAEGESVRLGAARSILELGTKLRESVEFEQRISRLEGAQA